MNRVRKIGRAHRNGDEPLESRTAVVADELLELLGRIEPAQSVPFGVRCELTTDCDRLVTHEVGVRVDDREGKVYGCLAHLAAWVTAGEGGDDG